VPTPIGHTLAGVILFSSQKKRGVLFFLLVTFFAMLPDIDFLFGFVVGDANRYHHLFTHSFTFVILTGLIGGWLYAKWQKESWLKLSAIFISAGISHVILDILALDKREPLGCPLWWPFSNAFVISPMTIFADVSRVSDSKYFIQSLFNVHNLKTVLIEVAILTPLLLVAIFWTKKNQIE
jgi:membrane-bound metal-dependent hydrolase YbcI (DUF457 family)